jgi:predicted GIY-YIG superfamily endonuclease
MIYMLKFSRPIGDYSNKYAQAQYYVGWCEDARLDERLKEHRTGRGAAITRHATQNGIQLEVVMTIPHATPEVEKRIKRMKNHRRVLERYERGTLRIV